MTDVLERLRLMIPKPGSSNGDVNAVVVATISDAIAEITKLRAQVADLTRIAGCVAVADAVEVPVKTFDDIKKEIKRG